jgi:hypothetical protein
MTGLASLSEIFQDHFFWGAGAGLALGLLLAAWVWISAFLKRAALRKQMSTQIKKVEAEVKKLREHLNTQMEISAAGTGEQKARLLDLEKQNENLRIAVQALQQKQWNASARTLEVWQRAVDSMLKQAPGFAGAWQDALGKAETEVGEMETGVRKFVRRFLGTKQNMISLPESATERKEAAGEN